MTSTTEVPTLTKIATSPPDQTVQAMALSIKQIKRLEHLLDKAQSTLTEIRART